MKRRVLILPASACIIAALVTWRLERKPPEQEPAQATAGAQQLAPRFELYDQRSGLVKFARYLGRTQLLICFFDGQIAPEKDPTLTNLLDHHAALNASGIEIVAVSSATPFAIREAERRTGRTFPFPVLTDIDRHSPIPVPVHRMWGLVDEGESQARTGLFFIERDGSVDSQGGYPLPIEHPSEFLDRLLRDSR